MRQTYIAAITIGESDVRAWELASDVPVLHNIWAYVCFGLNLLIPGTGTILAAMLGKTEFNINKTQVVIGVLQLLTSVYIIGWIWSVFWGYLIVKRSKGDHAEFKSLIGVDQVRSDQYGQPHPANRGGRGIRGDIRTAQQR